MDQSETKSDQTTVMQKAIAGIKLRIQMLHQSQQVLSAHKMDLDAYGYEPRIDELESFLHFLETECGRTK